MKVSRNSWHYRLYRYFFNLWSVSFNDDPWEGIKYALRIRKSHYTNPRPTSLCSYFWSVVGVTLLVPVWLLFLLIIGLAIVLFAVLAAWWLLPVLKIKEKNREEIERLENELYAGEISWDEYWRRKRQLETKTPNLFLSFLKAKKDKVCPLIKLVD